MRCFIKCPIDKLLRYAVENGCVTCDYEGWVSASSLVILDAMTGDDETIGLCNSLCPEREVINGFCVLKEFSSAKPLKGKDNICYVCNTTTLIEVAGVEDNCDICASVGRVVEITGGIKYCAIPCGYD